MTAIRVMWDGPWTDASGARDLSGDAARMKLLVPWNPIFWTAVQPFLLGITLPRPDPRSRSRRLTSISRSRR